MHLSTTIVMLAAHRCRVRFAVKYEDLLWALTENRGSAEEYVRDDCFRRISGPRTPKQAAELVAEDVRELLGVLLPDEDI